MRPVLVRRLSTAAVIRTSQYTEPLLTSSLMDRSYPGLLLEKMAAPELKNVCAGFDGSNNTSLTYKEAYDSTLLCASALRRLGVGKGDVVAIASPNHLHFFSTFQGIALTGAASTPINPAYTYEEMLFQVEKTKAKFIVAHPLCLDRAFKVAEKLKVGVVALDDPPKGSAPLGGKLAASVSEWLTAEKASSIDMKSFHAMGDKFDSNSMMTIPFSSGTTGVPKGVMLSHRNLTANTLQMMHLEQEQLKNSNSVVLCPLPFFHIYGMVVGLCLTYYAGRKLVFTPAFDLPGFLGLIQTHKVTRSFVVPPIVLALAKHPLVDKYDLSSLKCLMSGAAPLGGALQTACAARLKCVVKQGWGMTELSPVGTSTPDDAVRFDGQAGLLLPGTVGKIVDPANGKDLPSDQEGELCVKGPQVMKGYLNNKEATDNTIDKDGWLHTGDIGKFDGDGWLYITDRCKELIKYKGFQVPPAELEAVLVTMAGVKDAVVIPVPDDEGGEVPRAYVVKQDGAENLTADEVIAFVKEKVAPHKRLRGGVFFTDVIPKSPSGKILRRVQVDFDRRVNPVKSSFN